MKRSLILILLLCLSGAAYAQDVRVGIVTTPGSAQYVAAKYFQDLLAERSNGALKAVILHSGSLGSETDILMRLKLGDVQVAVITSAVFEAFVPEVAAMDYPFLFRDYAQVDRLLDGAPGQAMARALDRAGFRALAFSENGFRHLTNNKKPVRRAEDVKGLKLRVMESALHLEYWKMLGADARPMPWPITDALRSGVIDGQENPLSVIDVYRFFEVQKHLTLTGHVYSAHVIAAGPAWIDGLPKRTADMVAQCARDAAQRQRAWNRENERRFLDEIKAAGMQVVENPDLDSFRKAAAALRGQPAFQSPRAAEMLRIFMQAAEQQ